MRSIARRWLLALILTFSLPIRAEDLSPPVPPPPVPAAAPVPLTRDNLGTPLSAETYAPGHLGLAALAGFPFLRMNVGYGLTPWLDLHLDAKAAWADLQYAGLGARFRATQGGPINFSARATVSMLLHPVQNSLWFSTTGLQNYDLALDAVLSWRTSRGAVMSAFLRGDVIMSLQIPPHPLAGLGPYFGFNPAFHVAAELPTASGLVFSFELALNLHLAGFDQAVLTAPLVMPEFALGVGYIL